jgi:hypothetical protein
MVSLTVGVFALVIFGPTKGVCAVLTLPVLILVPLWFHGVTQFSLSCMEKPGWAQVLIEYHIYGVGLCVLIMASFGLSLFYAMRPRGHEVSPFVIVAILVAGFIGVVTLAPQARRRCKAKMDALQREVAVKLAGEYLRRKLSKGRR